MKRELKRPEPPQRRAAIRQIPANPESGLAIADEIRIRRGETKE
jgi:hypothetical protein